MAPPGLQVSCATSGNWRKREHPRARWRAVSVERLRPSSRKRCGKASPSARRGAAGRAGRNSRRSGSGSRCAAVAKSAIRPYTTPGDCANCDSGAHRKPTAQDRPQPAAPARSCASNKFRPSGFSEIESAHCRCALQMRIEVNTPVRTRCCGNRSTPAFTTTNWRGQLSSIDHGFNSATNLTKARFGIRNARRAGLRKSEILDLGR